MIQFETAIFNAKKEYFDNIVDELTNVLLLDKRTANYKPRQIKIIFTEQLLKNNWIPKLKIFDKKNSYIQLFKKKRIKHSNGSFRTILCHLFDN